MRRVALLLLLGTACSSAGGSTLSVFAASSLTEAFAELERGFEASRAGVDVAVTYAGSQVLRLQIDQGAPADVFASANESHMAALVGDGLIEQREVFAVNELVVIVPTAQDGPVTTFADLPAARRIVLGTENVPVGAYTEQLLDRAASRLGEAFAAGVRSRVVSRESNVRLVRAKVELGEADAAIVYRTDAVSSDRVRIVPIPDALQIRAEYHIGRLRRSTQAPLATAFVAFVASEAGREALEHHGFMRAP